ncbi:hypothetical protein [Nocardioides psychrotolerans]|nr:hypothetical protein [Nocardioides psychrotolerans]
MWDTVQGNNHLLSHDMPCGHCGHAMHTFLACSDSCDCTPSGAHTRSAGRDLARL